MVCPDVHLKVGLLVGTVAAVRAGEGPFSRVDPHVPCQKGREVESLPTDGALMETAGGGELNRGSNLGGGQMDRGLWEATPSEGRKCAASWQTANIQGYKSPSFIFFRKTDPPQTII